MAEREAIVRAVNEWLSPEKFQDYCPNGLQVEGRPAVERIVSGVTACQALLEAALEAGADLVLVHHGYFWKGEPQSLTGMKKRRLQTLLANDMNLLAYHLPLDAHPELGNNVRLAHHLGLENPCPLDTDNPTELVWQGALPSAMKPAELAAWLEGKLGREVLHLGAGNDRIREIGWCTGAAQGFIDRARMAGCQAYLSGEVSEPTAHIARETAIHYFAAGHHATERYGVQALGERIARNFGVDHRFIDIPNPV